MAWLGLGRRWESPHDFEWKVLKAFRKHRPKRIVFVDWLEHALRFNDKPNTWINLGKCYWTYCELDRADRRRMIGNLVTMEAKGSRQIGLESARPCLTATIMDQRARLDPTLDDVPRRQLAGPWVVALFVDCPVIDGFVTETQLAEWGIDFDAALTIALDNLRRQPAPEFPVEEGGFCLVASFDYEEATRVLLPELFSGLSFKGDPIAIAVSPHAFCVAGSEDADALAAMAEFVESRIVVVTRPIAYQPMRLVDGVWTPVESSDSVPDGLQWLRVKQTYWQYLAQRELLLGDEERDFRGCYLSEVNVREGDSGVGSWTTWAHDVPTLLAKTDGLGMTNHAGEQLFRAWDDVIAVCGPFNQEPNLTPVRYRLESWPSEDQWRRLQTECLEPSWAKYRSAFGKSEPG